MALPALKTVASEGADGEPVERGATRTVHHPHHRGGDDHQK